MASCLTGLKASAVEQYAACRCMEAMAVLLGSNHDSYFEMIEPGLVQAIRATGKEPQVRVAALRAVSMCAFVCGTDEKATNSLLDICEASCGKKWRGEEVPAVLRANALDSWGLLATTIGDLEIASAEGRGVTILTILQECLEESHPDLRSSAGECFALIHEVSERAL